MAALLGPKTEADLVKPDKKKKAKPAANGDNGAAPPAAKAKAAAKEGDKEEAEAWRTADPYAFLPKPADNNMVHTTVHFRWAHRPLLRRLLLHAVGLRLAACQGPRPGAGHGPGGQAA